jgi:pectate lyase
MSAVFVGASYEVGLQDTFYTKWHLSGNYIDGSVNQKLNADNYLGLDISEYQENILSCTVNNLKSDHHAVLYPVTTESAADAFQRVINQAGAFPRDTIDRRVIYEARNGIAFNSGSFNNHRVCGIIDKPEEGGGWPAYTTYNTIQDNDHDGMDDAWESANGLDPANAADRNRVTTSGYTCLEVYLNGLAGEPIVLDFPPSALNDMALGTVSAFIDPYSERLIVQSVSDLLQVKLIDLSGKMVKQFKPLEGRIFDVNFLPKGMYLVEIEMDNGFCYRNKVIK